MRAKSVRERRRGCLQDRVDELESLKRAWREEWDRVKSGHRQQVADLSAAVQALQSKLRCVAVASATLAAAADDDAHSTDERGRAASAAHPSPNIVAFVRARRVDSAAPAATLAASP